jgi:hypothetical protein
MIFSLNKEKVLQRHLPTYGTGFDLEPDRKFMLNTIKQGIFQSWAPALFSRSRAQSYKKKAREREEKKARKKRKRRARKKKSANSRFFFLGGTFVCMYVLLFVCI